jgi:hypothetical protein
VLQGGQLTFAQRASCHASAVRRNACGRRGQQVQQPANVDSVHSESRLHPVGIGPVPADPEPLLVAGAGSAVAVSAGSPVADAVVAGVEGSAGGGESLHPT